MSPKCPDNRKKIRLGLSLKLSSNVSLVTISWDNKARTQRTADAGSLDELKARKNGRKTDKDRKWKVKQHGTI